MLIDKLVFLYHGGRTIHRQVPAGTNPLAGIIVVIILLALGVGLWVLFTRKKSI